MTQGGFEEKTNKIVEGEPCVPAFLEPKSGRPQRVLGNGSVDRWCVIVNTNWFAKVKAPHGRIRVTRGPSDFQKVQY